jgi:2-methylisocitrate lyase-like PEP mutase family enzyme
VSLVPIGEPRQKITVASLRDKKLHHQPITCLTAYDYTSARLVDEAGIDMVLVGDSLAQAMLGYENTLSVTLDEMLHHTRAAHRGVKHALLVADMPFGSYQADLNDGIRNAARFVKEAGAEVVKVEGGEKRADLIRRIIDAEIPVAGHIGLTPQSVNVMGGVQGAGQESQRRRATDARRSGAGPGRRGVPGARRHPARSCRHDYGRGRDSDYRHRRWAGLRRTGARIPRYYEPYLCTSREVCAAIQ